MNVKLDWLQSPSNSEKTSLSKALSVRSINEKEFENEIKALEKMQNTGIIVQTDDQLKSEEKPRQTREQIYLSKNNQRVDHNMRAARIGEFKNVLEEGLDDDSASKAKDAKLETIQKNKISQLQKKLLKNDFIKTAPQEAKNLEALENDPSKLFALAPLQEKDEKKDTASDESRSPSSILNNDVTRAQKAKKGKGLSATDDFLEGVAIGPNTLLNTQEYKYYNFYERIRQLLVDRWRSKIRREIEKSRSPASGVGKLSAGAKITKLQVRMNTSGEVVAIDKIGLSGIESFDRTAEQSFYEAAPYPHPPADLVKNGDFTVRWDFVVVVEESSLIEFKVQKGM